MMKNIITKKKEKNTLASLNNSRILHLNAKSGSLIHSLKNPETSPLNHHQTIKGRFGYSSNSKQPITLFWTNYPSLPLSWKIQMQIQGNQNRILNKRYHKKLHLYLLWFFFPFKRLLVEWLYKATFLLETDRISYKNTSIEAFLFPWIEMDEEEGCRGIIGKTRKKASLF